MKKYRIKVTCKKSNTLVEDTTELSNTKKFIQKKYEAKYRFIYPGSKIVVERIIREPGIQTDLINLIQEMEAANG